MLPQLIASVGLPVLIDIVARALGAVNHPAARTASAALGNLQGALKSGALSAEQFAEANRHAERLAELEYQETQAALSDVNQSLRAEIASDDPYVRRMRPTFGYLMAFTWAAQMFAVAYIMVFETEKTGAVLEGMAALSAIWTVALSVLGLYVYKRSEEKRPVWIAPPDEPPPRIGAPALKAVGQGRGLNQ